MSPPLRVTFVLLHLDTGGLERVVTNVLSHLDRERFAPSLVLLHGRGELLAELPRDVEVRRLTVRSRYALPALLRTLRELVPDVLFAGTTPANLATLLAARRLDPRPPVVVNEHTSQRLRLEEVRPRWLYHFLMRFLYPGAARVGVPIIDVGLELREVLGRPELPIVELLNPVLDDRVAERAAQEPASPWPAAPTFVAAGRFVPAKGFDLLVRALALLDASPAPHLVLLGEGPEREALEGLGRELGVADRLSMPGMVANPFPYFRRAAGVVMCSRRESVSNVLVEAMAVGTPVVAADCFPGPRRVVLDGEAGLVVPAEDPPALAAAMGRLLGEPELVERLVARGRERAADFHLANTLGRYEEMFAELAGGAAAPVR